MPTDGAARPDLARFTGTDYGLYALMVFAWGFGWISLKLQLGVVPPEVSVVWRFGLAALVIFAIMAATGRRFAFPAADHARFALLGLLLFSFNFLSYYYAGFWLTSGLLSVLFSLSAVVSVLMAAAIERRPIPPRAAGGAVLGVGGVALMFAPEIFETQLDRWALVGMLLSLYGTVSFVIAGRWTARLQKRGLPIVETTGFSMAYGTVMLAIVAAVLGKPFIVDWSPVYLGTLLFLALVSSVAAFFAFMLLVGRIGSSRASYSTVMFPVVALAVSTAVEGYQWTWMAGLGLACVLGGILLVLRNPKAA